MRTVARNYETALIAFMESTGPFWREQRARHLLSREVGSIPDGVPVNSSSLPPHVFLPYYVPASQYKSVPNAELLSLRPTRIAYRGSLVLDREWITRVLVGFPRSGLWVQTSRVGIDECEQARLNHSFALVQLSLPPVGDTVHRRSSFESIAAGALPLRRLYNWHSSEFDKCLIHELRGALALPPKTNGNGRRTRPSPRPAYLHARLVHARLVLKWLIFKRLKLV
ncbi:hypothetical protein T492DRAFT_859610 [Pavlovales sp. CCMP2436]|nr:hypothetical protein T492DRAFT_859610 [Pavlovales sp. CCMP2436]